jgi:hypothetical protein
LSTKRRLNDRNIPDLPAARMCLSRTMIRTPRPRVSCEGQAHSG